MSARLVTIGGSQAAAAIGLDPYLSPERLSGQLLGRLAPPAETEAMRRGKQLERFMAETIIPEEGYDFLPAPADVQRSPVYKWAVGHADGFTTIDGRRGIGEVKCVGAYNAPNGHPHLAHLIQGQWYCWLYGLSAVRFFYLVGGQRLEVYTAARDDDALAEIVLRVEMFVKEVRRGNIVTADTGAVSDARAAILELYPEHEPGKPHRLSPRGERHLRALREIHEQQDVLAAARERHEKEILAEAGDAEIVYDHYDNEVVTLRRVLTHRVDWKKFRAQYPDLGYGQFTTVSSTRPFRLKKGA